MLQARGNRKAECPLLQATPPEPPGTAKSPRSEVAVSAFFRILVCGRRMTAAMTLIVLLHAAAAFTAPDGGAVKVSASATRRAPAPLAVLPVPSVLVPVAGLAVLTSVVVVHEAGHFFAARIQGIRVSEFAIGFGPVLWKAPASEDGPEYALRALPIGGFVSFPRATNRTKLEQMGLLKKGETFDAEVPNTPDLLENRPAPEQAIVMCAGVAANIVLAWACLFTSAVSLGIPVVEPMPIVITRVLPSSAAASAGFREGDLLLRVADKQLDSMSQTAPLDATLTAIKGAVATHKPFPTVVLRGNQRVTITVPSLPPEGPSSIGVEVTQKANKALARVRLAPSEAASGAGKAVAREARTILITLKGALGSLISPAGPGGTSGEAKLQGPIGIARMGNELAATDALQLLEFGALLSINLAVFNALPLPGLDGWQVSLLALEAFLRRPLPEAAKEAVNALAGLLFVFAFSRVVVGDLQAASGGALGAASNAVGNALRDLGPSILIGVAAAQTVRMVRDGDESSKQAVGRIARGAGRKTGTRESRERRGKPLKRPAANVGRARRQPARGARKPPARGRGRAKPETKAKRWWQR